MQLFAGAELPWRLPSVLDISKCIQRLGIGIAAPTHEEASYARQAARRALVTQEAAQELQVTPQE